MNGSVIVNGLGGHCSEIMGGGSYGEIYGVFLRGFIIEKVEGGRRGRRWRGINHYLTLTLSIH